MESLIKGWYSEIDSGDDSVSAFGKKVVLMKFFASEDFLWRFIKRATDLARNAKHLTTLASGPVEHLLGFHGEKWVGRFEQECQSNARFVYMMRRILRHQVSDEIWGRVRKMQRQDNSSRQPKSVS